MIFGEGCMQGPHHLLCTFTSTRWCPCSSPALQKTIVQYQHYCIPYFRTYALS